MNLCNKLSWTTEVFSNWTPLLNHLCWVSDVRWILSSIQKFWYSSYSWGFKHKGCNKFITWHGALQEGFIAFNHMEWYRMLLRLVFNFCVWINLKDDDLDLKAYSIYLTIIFAVTGHITYTVSNVKAWLLFQNISIFINFIGPHTCISFQAWIHGT